MHLTSSNTMRRVVALILLSGVSAFAFAQKDKKLTEKTVSKANIAAHLKFISSDALRGRDTPSQGLEVAASYLRTQLELYGVKPLPEYPDYFQPVAMKKMINAKTGEINIDTSSFSLGVDFLLMNGINTEFKGGYVLLDYGTPDEIAAADVDGKIVICKAGDGQDPSIRQWMKLSTTKQESAATAGAKGLIELYNSQFVTWQLLVNYLSKDRVMLDNGEQSSDISTIWLNDTDRSASEAFTNGESVEIRVAGASKELFTVNNIVGYVEGSDPEWKKDYVTFSAHYDHVGVGLPDSTGDDIYNGARDNGVGTVTVLEAAKNLAMYPTKRSSLFVLFAGEEKGLLGSQWFVNHSPIPLNEIVFCFNSDNGGYNSTAMATVIGRDRTTAKDLLISAIETYGLIAGDDEKYKEQGLFDRSDNVSFAKKGIPAPSFGMGVDEFDDQIFATYHQPSDEFETIDMDYLYTFYKAYVLAGRFIGNMKETPFWIEGDKYYEVGKELYGK